MITIAVSNPRITHKDVPFVQMLERQGFKVKLLKDNDFSLGHASNEKEIELLRDVSAVMAAGERYPAEVIKALPSLRVIARFGVGYDKVDIGAATKNNVVVTITPNSNYEAVAEHAMALILSLAKSIPTTDKAMRAGNWPRELKKPIRGTTLGIIGLGRIGRALAVRARAMKMKVLAAELEPDLRFVEKNDIQLLDLDSLLERSDYVSLHCALSDETQGMIDTHKLALMKSDAVLINTARGGLVIESDLIEVLKLNQIGGAGLDVFETEPTDPDNPLYSMENVIVSPHIAGNDDQSMEDMGNEAAQCIIDLFNSLWPEGAVINNELKEKWIW